MRVTGGRSNTVGQPTYTASRPSATPVGDIATEGGHRCHSAAWPNPSIAELAAWLCSDRARFADDGFWAADEGMLVIVDKSGEIVGEIEYFPITDYLVGYEISYRLFGSQHAGRGYTSHAVSLLTSYLFGRKRVHRMQLNIHPDNAASRRVAQKCGFTFEGLMRGCWFHRGIYHDLEIWSLLRDEGWSSLSARRERKRAGQPAFCQRPSRLPSESRK